MYTPRGALGGPNYMRSSISDGHLDRYDDVGYDVIIAPITYSGIRPFSVLGKINSIL